jgi:glycosyltransferase involved in cell wall biosynthesis
VERYYIADITGTGGISRYANHFYQHILAPLDYTLVDSRLDPADILSKITSEDIVHIETGIFSLHEQEILFRMVDSGYTRLRMTMHDPPLFRYPSVHTSGRLSANIVKVMDRYFGGQRRFRSILEKLQCIYVLSRQGKEVMQQLYQLNNIRVIPHIVPEPDRPSPPPPGQPDFVYIGFLGKNKGLEYAMDVHARLQKTFPGSKFRVAGTTLSQDSAYSQSLLRRSHGHVDFLGYVTEQELDNICKQSAFAFQPFRPYRGYTPVSGSIFYCMQRGPLVLTRPVNAIPELIRDGQNGIFLSAKADQDAEMIKKLWSNQETYERIRQNAYAHLIEHHSPRAVREQLMD